jgi:hypothetical protein
LPFFCPFFGWSSPPCEKFRLNEKKMVTKGKFFVTIFSIAEEADACEQFVSNLFLP